MMLPMATAKTRKTDRRTLYTRSVIKDAFLELTAQMPYEKINITKLCKQADIARATFYLHFENLDEVLDSVLDDALLFSEGSQATMVDALDAAREGGAQGRAQADSVLPACQRIADSQRYHSLFMDPAVSDHIIRRIAVHERDKVVPQIMARTGVAEDEAEMLFRFLLHGTFAVNTSLGWKKDERWYRYQNILGRFIGAAMG